MNGANNYISYRYKPEHPSFSSLLSRQSLYPSQTLEYCTQRLFLHLKLDAGHVAAENIKYITYMLVSLYK